HRIDAGPDHYKSPGHGLWITVRAVAGSPVVPDPCQNETQIGRSTSQGRRHRVCAELQSSCWGRGAGGSAAATPKRVSKASKSSMTVICAPRCMFTVNRL